MSECVTRCVFVSAWVCELCEWFWVCVIVTVSKWVCVSVSCECVSGCVNGCVIECEWVCEWCTV